MAIEKNISTVGSASKRVVTAAKKKVETGSPETTSKTVSSPSTRSADVSSLPRTENTGTLERDPESTPSDPGSALTGVQSKTVSTLTRGACLSAPPLPTRIAHRVPPPSPRMAETR